MKQSLKFGRISDKYHQYGIVVFMLDEALWHDFDGIFITAKAHRVKSYLNIVDCISFREP